MVHRCMEADLHGSGLDEEHFSAQLACSHDHVIPQVHLQRMFNGHFVTWNDTPQLYLFKLTCNYIAKATTEMACTLCAKGQPNAKLP